MLYIENESHNPYYNLALEEYVFVNFTDDDYILLWQNDRTIVVGKYQNTLEEINAKEAEAQDVKIVRRNTGGGAVYHDLGNLNFSFISDWERENGLDYDRFITPVADALKKYGVKAHKSGRNDIVIDERKISGNAQCVKNGRVLHHGTLLVDSDLEMLRKVLNVSADKIRSKGIKSVRARVANISEFSGALNVEELKNDLLDSFFAGEVRRRVLTQAELDEIELLAEKKYATWEWNYGHSPDFNYKNAVRFAAGKIEVNLEIREGFIQRCGIYGDFLGMTDITPIENALVGVRYEKPDINAVLERLDTTFYLGVSPDEFLECF